MHPNPLFRPGDRGAVRSLVESIGFGMVFAATPDGPRVAHTPLIWAGEDAVRFHLARGNALTPHLTGARALVTVNGPSAYVSPRWYDDRNTVPTWDYAAVELDGTVAALDEAELDRLLYDLIDREEGLLAGDRWQADEVDPARWRQLLRGIVGFELRVEHCRATFKLSQKRSAADRARIAAAQEARGHGDLAAMMRAPAP